MSEATTIKINPAKNSDLEFDVMIQGMDNNEPPVVKFASTSEAAGCDYAFRCTKVEGEETKHRWLAKLPALQHIKESEVKFHVEVIVDGYYFEPAMGTVILVTEPGVKFQPNVTRPTVTTSFTVRQEEDKPEEKPAEKTEDKSKEDDKGEEDEQVTITGQYAPTNGLLKPEFPPPQSHVKTAQAVKDDQAIDMSKLASHVVPGQTTDPEPQDDGKDEGDEDGFDPARVAEQIVRSTVEQIEKPTTQGMFFKRRNDGSPIVEGIDTGKDAAAKRAKADKVKQILGKK